jgi:hypothetical protein
MAAGMGLGGPFVPTLPVPFSPEFLDRKFPIGELRTQRAAPTRAWRAAAPPKLGARRRIFELGRKESWRVSASARPKRIIRRTGVEEIHIDRVKSADRFEKPLRETTGRGNELFLMEKFIVPRLALIQSVSRRIQCPLLPQKRTNNRRPGFVRFVPKADICSAAIGCRRPSRSRWRRASRSTW